MAKIFIIFGIVLLLVGLLINFFPGILSWFGNLPGDIKIERENSRIVIPITTMILLSIIVTVLLNLIRWLFSK